MSAVHRSSKARRVLEARYLRRGALQRDDVDAERVVADVLDQGRLQEIPGLPEAQRVCVTA